MLLSFKTTVFVISYCCHYTINEFEHLNSNLTFIESRANILETEHSRLTGKVGELQAMNGQLKIELESEAKNRKSETEALAKKLAESMKTVESFR